jgi:AAA+ ATPase superfamily predicted ATPase
MPIIRNQLEKVVEEQALYMLSHEDVVLRDIAKEIVIDIPRAIIITGVRRSGKSTLLRHILQENKEETGCIHFDDPRLLDFEVEDFYWSPFLGLKPRTFSTINSIDSDGLALLKKSDDKISNKFSNDNSVDCAYCMGYKISLQSTDRGSAKTM